MRRICLLLCAALLAALFTVATPALAEVHLESQDGKYALADDSGFLLTDYIFDEILLEGSAPYRVKRSTGVGCIDAQGHEVVPAIYDDIQLPFQDGLAPVLLNEEWGFIDTAGRLVIRPSYIDAYPFEDGLAMVAYGDTEDTAQEGFIDTSGQLLGGQWFDFVEGFSEGLAMVVKDDACGFLDASGQLAIPLQYEAAESFSEGLAMVVKDDACGYIDKTGKFAIEPTFEYAESFQDGWAEVVSGGKSGAIDKTGAWLLEPQFDRYASISTGDDGLLAVTEDYGGSYRYFDLSTGVAREVKAVGSSIDLSKYMPFTGSKVATLSEERTLSQRVSYEQRLPCLDGATALFPVYASFCQTVYPKGTRYTESWDVEEEKDYLITCTKTNKAYERLIAGDADIIFVAQPSDEELAMAAEKGVEFDMIPIGKEAFVFIVNKDNPLDAITMDEIKGVYSGVITDWSQLGVQDMGSIVAYQRPKNSGSQTALEALMGDTPLMKAPQGTVAWDMGDIVDNIEYRNLPNAIGYSFRFFCTDMLGSEVKLLAVDGVEPTEANIRNGSYPIVSTLYAIRLKGNDNPNVVALLDWIQSPQGMELVEKSGYTPWEY